MTTTTRYQDQVPQTTEYWNCNQCGQGAKEHDTLFVHITRLDEGWFLASVSNRRAPDGDSFPACGQQCALKMLSRFMDGLST